VQLLFVASASLDCYLVCGCTSEGLSLRQHMMLCFYDLEPVFINVKVTKVETNEQSSLF